MIDSHCHIDLYKQPLEIAKACERQQICTVAVTHLPSHFQQAELHLKGFHYVRAALGLHPLSVNDHGPELMLFHRLAGEARLIGEIGLDFSSAMIPTKVLQEESFDLVLEAIRGKSPLITLHSRCAEDAVLSHLRRTGVERAIFHWFSGTKPQLVRVLDDGHFVSINAAMVTTTKWSDLIRFVPKNRVLTESDGPFARYQGRPTEPSSVSAVLRWLAEKWSDSPVEVEKRVRRNFNQLAANLFPLGDY